MKFCRNVIYPIRIFGQSLTLNGRFSLGYSICFRSDGPHVISSKVLPNVELNTLPQITFIGSKDQWRKEQNKYKNLYSIPVGDVYSWLNVLSQMNGLFIDKRITINN